MKECIFDKVNEKIFVETLDNGITVYLYPFTKTKNFYATISVKYGAKHNKYKVDNKIYDVIPGTAHFLEHRIMILGEDEKLSKRINDLGSIANAWTGYHATNYNIYGSENIIENIRVLLDLFHHPTFNDKDVDAEKGIISEEIDMCKDQINRFLYNELMKNTFINSYPKNTVIGEKEDINKVTAKYLKQIYDHFYSPNNTFIVITGNFDKDEIIDEIKSYYKNLKLKNSEIPKIIKEKEEDRVRVEYQEIKKENETVKIKMSFKMKKDIFKLNDSVLLGYMTAILKSNFSSNSKLYEKYKNNDYIINMAVYPKVIDEHLLVICEATTNKPNEFIVNFKKDINNLKLDEESFEICKKTFVKNYVLEFENIEDVEAIIVEDLTMYGHINYDGYDEINSLEYTTAVKVMNLIDINNICVVRTIK